jgi:DNA-binding transcriptional LysR family regulator
MKNEFSNWSDVRVFLAVLRAGSTLQAATALGMSQPTVARRIETLEHTLGLTLFTRDTRGFHPTAAAIALLAPAEAIEAAASEFAASANALKGSEHNTIRITAIAPAFTNNLARILSEFTQTHPNTRFQFLPADRTLDLCKGEADVAIRYARKIDDPNLICRKISEATGSLYASHDYAKRHGLPGSEHELDGHSFIVFDNGIMGGFHDWLYKHIRPDQIVMRCSEFEAMRVALQSGLGIGPLGSGLGDTDDMLVRCFPPIKNLTVTTWLLISPQAYKRPEVKQFTAFFAPRYTAMLKAQRKAIEAARDVSAPESVRPASETGP